MTRIVTLTMNPAIDVFCTTEVMHTDSKSRCRIDAIEPGGGGINVARNMRRMGADVTAIYTAGGANGAQLTRLLQDDGLPVCPITVAGDTTRNIGLTEESTDKHYHLVFPGVEMTRKEWGACLEAVAELSPRPDYLILSGSLPPSVPPSFSGDLARLAQREQIRYVIDTAGDSLLEATRAGVYLSKLNREDFITLGYQGSNDIQERLEAMNVMVEKGYADILVLTLGENGALLACKDSPNLHARPLPVEVVSHVGAGDSFVSMMTFRLSQGRPVTEAFCYGVAAAAAAINTEGNQLRDLALVERIYQDGLVITEY